MTSETCATIKSYRPWASQTFTGAGVTVADSHLDESFGENDEIIPGGIIADVVRLKNGDVEVLVIATDGGSLVRSKVCRAILRYASVGTHPEGRDGEAGSVRSMGDAVTAQPADAQPTGSGD